MANWHLDELRSALEKRDWHLTAELPGDDYKISATWELRRPGDSRALFIEFEGNDDLRVLPIEKSYACYARNTKYSLYFRRRGESRSTARARWRRELLQFVEAASDEQAV